MTGICNFCGHVKELTRHHIIAQKYNGSDDGHNIIPDICRSCHDQLEQSINRLRSEVGAGINPSHQQQFMIGSALVQLAAGSAYLDASGMGMIDAGSPILGISCHIKDYGQNNIEAAFSGGSVVLVTGSPADSWVIYSYLCGQGN